MNDEKAGLAPAFLLLAHRYSCPGSAPHHLVTAGQVVLLYGLKRAERPPDALHPLGYGRELYFWSFVLALLTFTLGAGVTAYEGVAHIRRPLPIENALAAYLVLAAAFLQAAHPEVIAVFVKPEDRLDQIVLPGRFPGRARRLSGRMGGSAAPTGPRA